MKSLDLDFGSFPQFTKEGSTNYLFGANNAWVSDIWAFWDLIIRRHKIKTKKAKGEIVDMWAEVEITFSYEV